MKLKMTAVTLILACGTAAAQTPDMPNRVRGLLAGPAPAPGTVVNATRVEPKPANAPGEISAQPGDALPLHSRSAAGRRDPFVSPVVDHPGGPLGCVAGKRCLVVDQVVLRGIVRTPTGMIAVVANSANKAYFLREKDPVFNGMVVKITGDSVVFKESTVDNAGRTNTREVVKKVSPTPAV